MDSPNSIEDIKKKISTLVWDISVIGNEKVKARKKAELDELLEILRSKGGELNG